MREVAVELRSLYEYSQGYSGRRERRKKLTKVEEWGRGCSNGLVVSWRRCETVERCLFVRCELERGGPVRSR